MASHPSLNAAANPPTLPGGVSPDSIDVTSELYTVLSRVRYTDKNGSSAANGDGDHSKPGAGTPANGPSGATPAGGAGGSPGEKPLSTKDVAAATDPIRHKIQRARAAVHTLPDIERTIPEQEAEIREWEDKIARQKEVLQQLREFGIQFSHGSSDVEMGGTGAQSPRTPTSDVTADSLMVSVAEKEYEEDFSMRGILGQGAFDGSPLSPPSGNKDSNAGIETGAEGQSTTEGLIRDTTTVEGDLEAQDAIMGTKSLQQELVEEELGPTLEHHAYERRPTGVPTSDNAGVVEEMGRSSTAPVGSASGEIIGEEGLPELVGKQDSELQEAGKLLGYPTEALHPRMPDVTRPDQFATAPESPRGLEHISHADLIMEGEANIPASGIEAAVEAIRQAGAPCNSLLVGGTEDEPSGTKPLGNIELKHARKATVDATTSKVVSGNETMEVGVVTPKAPDQSALELLQTKQDFIAEDENIQLAHAGIVAALPEDAASKDHGTSTAELPPQQRPSLAATNGWLRIEIPAHFSAVRNQLYLYKSMEAMQSAPKATGKRSRPNVRTSSARKMAKFKLNHSPGGTAKDSKSGKTASSSSAAISQETPRNARAQHGDSYGRASEEEEVMLLTDPLETDHVELGSQGDGTADENHERDPSALGAQFSKDVAAHSIGDSTESATVAEPAAGRVTRNRNRGRGSGRGQRGH